MEAKDWVTLLVPIASNGLLLFLFQQAVLQGRKREDRRNDYNYQTLTQLLGLLQKFYTAVFNIRNVDEERSGRKVEFADVWNPAANLIVQIKIFHETHPITTKKVDTQLQKCMEKWDEMTTVLLKSRKENGGTMSQAASERFVKDYEGMQQLIQECLQQCEKEILKI